jgi:hypothetical protein
MKRLDLRLPDDLHAAMARAAEQHRRSLNGEIEWALCRYLVEEAVREAAANPPIAAERERAR